MNTLHVTISGKNYGRRKLLYNIGVQCRTGEVVAIFGANGSGKSTLLRIIFGLIKVESVQREFNGRHITASELISKQLIGYLPQENFLSSKDRVRDIIQKIFKGESQQEKIFYASAVGTFANNIVQELSLGQLRYFQLLLLANMSHPFLLLDEPFAMLDPIYQQHVNNLIISLRKDKGLIITDHYYNEVLGVSTRNMILAEKTLLEIKDISDLRLHGYLR